MARGSVAPGSTEGSPYVPVSPPPPRPYRDLCSTCRHDSACGSRSTPERPILFCELFEVLVPVWTPPAIAAPLAGAASEQGGVEHKGLCMNCENRESCTTSQSQGGVWHCEEYG